MLENLMYWFADLLYNNSESVKERMYALYYEDYLKPLNEKVEYLLKRINELENSPKPEVKVRKKSRKKETN